MRGIISVPACLLIVLACCSCSKTCTCKATFKGETFMEKDILPEAGKSCTFYNDTVVVMGVKVERKCANFSLDGIL